MRRRPREKAWCVRRMCAGSFGEMERHNLIETRIREMIEEGTLLWTWKGSALAK